VISQVAEKRPAKVTTFISLAAFLLRKGAVPPQHKVRADRHSALLGLTLPEASALLKNASQKP
jgi:hypothetical protein